MNLLTLKKPFQLESGNFLEQLSIGFHTYGSLNHDKSNVVWVCHALTANSDVADWWSPFFGEGKLLDPSKSFIVCANIIGSNYGTTGPLTPISNKRPLAQKFPFITIRDIVNAHEVLRSHLKIEKIKTVIGASLGGQQVLEWNILRPELFENTVLIATNARHSAYGIAFNESQRLAIYTDPTYGDGTLTGGRQGLITARSIAMLSYRSYEGYAATQTNPGNFHTENYLASSYQYYQGQKLANRFNAYSYVILSKAMDSHNVGRNRRSIEDALSRITAKTLVVGIESDLLFPLSEQQYLAKNIKNACFERISSDFGHDGFLIESKQLTDVVNAFFENKSRIFKSTSLKLNYN